MKMGGVSPMGIRSDVWVALITVNSLMNMILKIDMENYKVNRPGHLHIILQSGPYAVGPNRRQWGRG